MDKIVILKEINHLSYFDGIHQKDNCQTKQEYWLGSADAEKFMKACISFTDDELGDLKINLFEGTPNTINKYLSEFQAPERGFYKDDLKELSMLFKFNMIQKENGLFYAVKRGDSLELIITRVKEKWFFLIYSVIGSRYPESIYIYGLYKVKLDNEFKKKYLNRVDGPLSA